MSRMEFGWVVQPSRAGLTAAQLMEHNRRFLHLLEGDFKTAWVEDHFQWEDRETLECWTTLTWLAAEFPAYTWGPLVLGQSYRNPALLAKMAATLQNLTGGRTVFGIGAGWKEDEYHAYGWDYPPAPRRIEQLAEAIQIARLLWTQAPASFDGKYYHLEKAYCMPHPAPPPPIMVGATGERYALRVAAQHGDWWNGPFISPEDYGRKLTALKRHCAEVGRDEATLRKTYFGFVSLTADGGGTVKRSGLHVIAGDPDAVTRELEALGALGCDLAILRFLDYPETRGAELFLSKVLPRF